MIAGDKLNSPRQQRTRLMSFTEKLQKATQTNNSLLCIGLDPDPARIPSHLGSGAHAVVAFNKAVIRATQDIACAYKPNLGFYTLYGHDGIRALQETRRAIPNHIPVILDAKVGDIDVTSSAYAKGYFGEMGFDAVTAHPYLGLDGLEPLLAWDDRCVFILAKTSNPGSGELQDLKLAGSDHERTVYEHVASQVAEWQGRFGTCGLVAGATYPQEVEQIRKLAPDIPMLIPGVGSQGGNLEATVQAALKTGSGPVAINASRSIIYAGEGQEYINAVRDAAVNLRDQINEARQAG
jgi:orotidine-5'-phosphate decarboxylase